MQLGNLSQNLSTINFSELSKFIFKVLKYLKVKAHNEYNNEGTQFKGSISTESFCMFMHFYSASFSMKTCFYETSNVFYLEH